MSNLADIKIKVVDLVKDETGKLAAVDYNAQDVFDKQILSAIARYSKHNPDKAVVDISGNNSHYLPLPDAWDSEFSFLQSVEYPIGEAPPAYLDGEEYGIYQGVDGQQLMLYNYILQTADKCRITFTVQRADDTIPVGDEDAFCMLAAAFCLEVLANTYIQLGDSLVNADGVNYRSKSQEAGARAKRYMAMYKEHMGIKEDDDTLPASAVRDLDTKYPGGSERLTHQRRLRRMR